MRTKTLKAKKPVSTTTLKSVNVALNKTLNLTATQESTVVGKGKEKTVTAGPVRFALTDTKGNLVATTGNKKVSIEKFNKKNVKAVAPSVLPIVKKLVKTGEVTL